jgi:hypothetical protein
MEQCPSEADSHSVKKFQAFYGLGSLSCLQEQSSIVSYPEPDESNPHAQR